MSDSNRIAIAYREEVTPGTLDSGAFQAVNFSGQSLKTQKGTQAENTIRSDANLRGLVQTSMVPQGGFSFDFIYGNMSDLLQSYLKSSWSTLIDITGTDATVSSNVITADSGTPYASVVVGQVVKITYSSTTYVGRVSAVGGSGASLTIVGPTLADLGVAANVDIKGRYMRNGTTPKHFTIEREHDDVSGTGKYFPFYGMAGNQFSLSMAAEQIVTGDCSFLGMSAGDPSGSSIATGAYGAAVTAESFAGLSGNLNRMELDGTAIGTSVSIQQFSIQMASGVRRDAGINVSNLGFGKTMVSGSLQAYFAGGLDVVDDFYSHEDSSIWVVTRDPSDNYFGVYVPRIKLGDFNVDVGGGDQPTLATLQWTGVYDSTLGITVQLDEMAA